MAAYKKFLLWLAATAIFPAGNGLAAELAAIRLPGNIAANASIGLAFFAPDSLYAAYWDETRGDRPWQLVIYRFDVRTGKLVGKAEVEKAQPLRSRDGDPIQTAVRLSISPDGSIL